MLGIAPQSFASQNLLRRRLVKIAKIAVPTGNPSCMCTVMAHNFRGSPGLDDGMDPAKKGDQRDEMAVDIDPLADAGVCRRLQDVLLVATRS